MRQKKWLKRTGIAMLVAGLLALTAHFLIVYRAKQILNFIVMEASGNRYTVSAEQVRFRYIPFTIFASKITVSSTDTALDKTYYLTSADSLTLQVSRIIPLFSKRNLALENVKIVRPVVEVFDKDTSVKVYKPLNQTLDDIQHALLATLTDFSIKNCEITDAGIEYKHFKPGVRPFYVNHVTLNIRNLSAIHHEQFEDSTVSFKADVTLSVNHPLIQLPNPAMNLYVENLLLDTRQNVFTINRLNLYNRHRSGSVDSVNLSNIKLSRFNWNRWLKEGLIEIDSLKANNGSTFFDFSGQQMFVKNKGETSSGKSNPYIDFFLHHVEINKINYGLRLSSPSGPFNVELNGDSLAVGNVSLSDDSIRPFKIGSLAFRLSDFSNEYDSRKNTSTFEKLIIDQNNLQLVNFKQSLDLRNTGAGSNITIPSLRLLNFSLDDLFQYKLVADKVILDKPAIVIDAQHSGKKRNIDNLVANLTNSLKPSLSIKQLSIRNAAIILLTGQNNGGRLSIEELNTEIDARQLLNAKSVLDMISSATALSSSGFKVTGKDLNLVIQRSSLNAQKSGVLLALVQGEIGSRLRVNLNNIGISNNTSKIDLNNLTELPVDNLTVGSGSVQIDLSKHKTESSTRTKALLMRFGNIVTGPVDVDIKTDSGSVHIAGAEVNSTGLSSEKGEVSWNNLNIKTGQASLLTKSVKLQAASLQVLQPGEIKMQDIQINLPVASAIHRLEIPALTIAASFNNTSQLKAESQHVLIEKPTVFLSLKAHTDSIKQPVKLPDFFVQHLEVRNPVIKLTDAEPASTFNVAISTGTANITGLQSKAATQQLTAVGLQAKFVAPDITLKKQLYHPGSLAIKAHDLVYKANSRTFSTFFDTALLTNLNVDMDDEAATKVVNINAGISNYSFMSSDTLTLQKILATDNWWVNADQLSRVTKYHLLTIYNPCLQSAKLAGFDSLHFFPRISKDSFWSVQTCEKDFNTLSIGAATFRNWMLSKVGSAKKLTVKNLSAANVDFVTLKDKTRAPDTVTYRPLLASSLGKIPLSFAIDTVELKNSVVDHFAILDRSKRQGNIFFTAIGGRIYNVRNTDITPQDTLKFRLTSRIMGQGDLLVGFSQSYVDSLQGFSLRAKMGRLNLTALNRLLVPLVSIKIEKGITDSLLLSVGANDFVAYGGMDMRFHGLRVALLRKGEKKYFLSSFSNWLINIFVHTNDDSNRNVVFQERLRNKSIYNFWGKIAINGLLGNLGIKRDKKQIRKYNKAVRQGDVPAVDPDLL